MSIGGVASKLGLDMAELLPFGRDKAKIPREVMGRPSRDGKLILVTALTPTPAGEGKTTTSIGLVQALDHLGHSVAAALREPSLGPCFGVKGGGTGGGRSRLEPSTDINLHFTGDLHAITAAHNLIAAMLDNHIHFESEPRLDPRRVRWPRVLDQNDRALRHAMVGLGGRSQGVPRETSFDITAASEVMAMLCLSEDADDLRARLDRTLLGFRPDRTPFTVGDLPGATGSALALLRDALLPNLVRTTDGSPAIVHGGPFANIAHGCNSVIATRTALHLADWVVTEAGFGCDLGAEKFFDIKCRQTGLDPVAVVMVATCRALKYHGGMSLKDLVNEDAAAVERGLPNLERHLETIAGFGKTPVVALNRRAEDTDAEIEVARKRCAELGVRFAASDHFAQGGKGAIELAEAVLDAASQAVQPLRFAYELSDPIDVKIRSVARKVYGASDIVIHPAAAAAIKGFKRRGWDQLPLCMAKTQSSLSDDPRRRGRPTGFDIGIRELRVNTGAGFIVALTGDINRMPGLPRRPAAADIDLVDGTIVGVS